jgi:hypothetical protein
MTKKSQQAGDDPGSVTIRKCRDFTVTGDGSSAVWNSTEWMELVSQGSDGIAYETKVKVLYSGTGIYFLFHCQDEKLTTTMKADNLNLWEEDVVEVFLWTSEDFPVYFEYEISPMDYELPIMVPNYKGKFLGWLPWNYGGEKRVLHATSATGGTKKSGGTVSGWMAEFFIPYKLLIPLPKVPPASGTKWIMTRAARNLPGKKQQDPSMSITVSGRLFLNNGLTGFCHNSLTDGLNLIVSPGEQS